jgi:hypothetical protein
LFHLDALDRPFSCFVQHAGGRTQTGDAARRTNPGLL